MIDIIRAWKDPTYRNSLKEAEKKQLPAYPAGLVELPEEQLESVLGACHVGSGDVGTWGCCGSEICCSSNPSNCGGGGTAASDGCSSGGGGGGGGGGSGGGR